MLNVSEVLVIAQIHCLFLAKSTEGLLPAHLVRGGQLESTLGAHMTVVFNSVDDHSDAIDFGEVALGHLNLFLLAFVRVFSLLLIWIIFSI